MNIMLKFSQLNGLIGDIFSGVGNFFQNLFQLIFMIIFVALYNAYVVPISLTMDAIQLVFRKFAGLDTYVFEGEVQSGDIVLSLINNQTVQNVFWSLLILAVVLLIITTIVAIIRAQTQTMDDKNRKTNNQIFVSAVKALINFFMVPVVAILGIFMGNALLKSLDQATSGGNNTKVSSMLFVSCAYECNRARTSTDFASDLANGYNDMGVIKGTPENIAEVVDQAFKNGTSFESRSFDFSKGPSNLFSDMNSNYFYFWVMKIYSVGTATINRSVFSVYDMWQVFYYYDLTSFNYIMYIVASVFVLWVLLTTSVGLIKRMFKLVILLIISPPIAALMPLDNGTALGKWRKEFIGSTLSAYATVVAFNLTMMLLGPISEIKFFYIQGYVTEGVAVFSIFNLIIQILIICGALFFFKGFTKSISDMIGAENAYSDGGEASKAIASKVAKAGVAVASAFSGGAAAAAAKSLKAAGKAKKAALDGAKIKTQLAQDKVDKLKDKPDNDPEKMAAKKELDAAKEAEGKMQGDYDKNQSAMKEYEQQAHERLTKTRDNALSLATNGLSDSFTDPKNGLPSVMGDKASGGAKAESLKARQKYGRLSRKERKMLKQQEREKSDFDKRLNSERQSVRYKELEKTQAKFNSDANELANDFKDSELAQFTNGYIKDLNKKDITPEQREKIQHDYELAMEARRIRSVKSKAKQSMAKLDEKEAEYKEKLKDEGLTENERKRIQTQLDNTLAAKELKEEKKKGKK